MAEQDEVGRATARPTSASTHERGLYNLTCWNGLSLGQQEHMRTQGFLPLGYRPLGPCERGASVEIVTVWDEFPGPRFYCLGCAIAWLEEHKGSDLAEVVEAARRYSSGETW